MRLALLLALMLAAGPAAAFAPLDLSPTADQVCRAELGNPVAAAQCAVVVVLCLLAQLAGGVCIA